MADFSILTDDQLLALCIKSEAAGEPIIGQLAVGYVVLNRVKRQTWYGLSIREVILKPWQFSWFNNPPDDLPEIEQSHLLIAELVQLKPNLDFTQGATHFHATYVAPIWARGMTVTYQVGRHIFYREG